MKNHIIVIGLGQIGTVFSKGFIKVGHPVYPILRGEELNKVAKEIPLPLSVLVSVREEDLHSVLSEIPSSWKASVALVQNELLPMDWKLFKIQKPTIISVWFEKREGKRPDPYYPSPVYGPQSKLYVQSLEANNIPAETIKEKELVFQLVRKNMYIISKNIVGLAHEGTVGEVLANHRSIFLDVAKEIFMIQNSLTDQELDRERVFSQLERDIKMLPEKGTAGSSAPSRLNRMIHHAKTNGIDVPTLINIKELHLLSRRNR